MPAKAVEECPEGKDLRPPSTAESLLAGKWSTGLGLRRRGRISYPEHAFSL